MAKSKRIDKPPDIYTGSQTEWDALSENKQYYIVNKVKISTKNRIRNGAKDPAKKSACNRLNAKKNAVQIRAYAVKNKDHIAARKKKYCEEKKDHIAARKKKYRDENKARISVDNKKNHSANRKKNNTRGKASARALAAKKRELLYENIAVAVAASYKEMAARA